MRDALRISVLTPEPKAVYLPPGGWGDLAAGLISVLTPEPKAVYPPHGDKVAEVEIEFQCSPLSRRLCTGKLAGCRIDFSGFQCSPLSRRLCTPLTRQLQDQPPTNFSAHP